jgi:hypothetical protein
MSEKVNNVVFVPSWSAGTDDAYPVSELLPQGHRLRAEHITVEQSKKAYGPTGRLSMFEVTGPRVVPNEQIPCWHVVIERLRSCRCCSEVKPFLWFKGDGFTFLEAFNEALGRMKHYDVASAADSPCGTGGTN